ncbi:hypothetical protein AB0I49_29485 [Streptomyces sp. NPDC050617]|uniref:hypothetical protein n=1 Tax=Streptomyces sp. NPDC050617 TaxID=3154628 RepID=UPI00342B6840
MRSTPGQESSRHRDDGSLHHRRHPRGKKGGGKLMASVSTVTALSAVLLLAGCSQERDAVTKWPPATHNPQSVNAQQLGDAWPVKPQKGTVSCVKTHYSGFAIIFTAPDGKEYALNNVAHDEQGLPSADTLKASSKTTTMWRLRMFGMQVCSAERAKHMRSAPSPTAD